MPNSIFYSLGIGFASGIFLRSFFDIGKHGFVLVLLISVACALVLYTRGRKPQSLLLITSVAVLSIGLGVLRLDHDERSTSALAPIIGEAMEFEGIIVREPDYRTNTVHLFVELDEYDERVLVLTDRFMDFEYGDRVSVNGSIETPKPFETDLGRTFDYAGYLKARGVRYSIPFADVEVLSQGEGSAVIATLLQAKHSFMRSFESIVPEPMAGLGEGVLLGVKRAIGEKLEGVFRDTGIIHIVVLSGYNVMIVVEGVMWLLSFAFFPRTRVILGSIAILGFATVVGFGATVVRASIMAILLLIARATGRTYAVLRGLMLAGVAMLIHNPYLLAYDPGFALSFLATLGLILVAPLVEERLYRVPSALGAREFLTATIATQLFVLPFLLYSMGTFSLVAVMVNVLVLPMVPIAMFLTFVTGLAGLISHFLGLIPGFFAYLSLAYIIKVAELFALLPLASFSVPAFPFWVVVVSYTAIGFAIYRFTRKEGGEIDEKTVKVVNDYSDWVIEEEKEMSPEARRPSGDIKKTLPFR